MSEERLLQRLEDLDGRLAELRERLPQSCMDERYDRRFYARLTNEATDAAIPAHLFTVEDVLTAIERAKERLDALCLERAHAAQRTADVLPGQLVFAGLADAPLTLAS